MSEEVEIKEEKKRELQREKGKGIVKCVLSGDTIVVFQFIKKKSPPQERIISLSYISAPKLARKNTTEEPWAWASREYLRKKCIGKMVTYFIEFKSPSKDYGIVFVNTKEGEPQENLALSIVRAGLARVKKPTTEIIRSDIEELIQAEDQAIKDGLEIHSKKEGIVRNIIQGNPSELFSKLKNKSFVGIVEQVRSGHSLRVLYNENKDNFQELNLYLSGVECPENEEANFAKEAKFFTEYFTLNREINIALDAVDKRNYYGTINVGGRNINEEILADGLGKYVEWSGQRSSISEKLKAAEKKAQENRIRIWSQMEAQKKEKKEEKKGKSVGKEIVGNVVEVTNSGAIVVQDNQKNQHKINLSSIKIPRGGSTQKKQESDKEDEFARSIAWEGKEFLRKRLIGQKVRCILDYTRPGKKDNSAEKKYYSVYKDKNNVAVELVRSGCAEAQEHKGAEPRSKEYEQILLAESQAKKDQLGVHQNPEKATPLHIADLTTDQSKTAQFLPFLQRAGRVRGIVQYEFSATKLKIYIPKETCEIALSISGIKAPSKNDPLNDEATLFTRSQCHQQEVELEVYSRDKAGNLLGSVWLWKSGKKENLASLLLEEGLATTIPAALRENENSKEYSVAEEIAKKGKRNLWKNYDEEAEQEKIRQKKEAQSEKHKAKTEFLDVVVTEIVDASVFYVQIVDEEKSKELDEIMKQIQIQALTEPYTPKVDELVIAQFSDDETWYRARVKSITPDGQYTVFYIDYGNSEVVSADKIRSLDQTFTKLPPQAHEARLAYIKPPTLNEDYGHEAAVYFKELVDGKQVVANVEARDNDVLYLTLGDRETQTLVNAALLRAGLAKLEKPKGSYQKQLIEKLREEEDYARSNHLYIWEYGDPGSDDEDTNTSFRPRRKR